MKMTHNNISKVLVSDRLYSLKLYIIVNKKDKMEVKK